MACEESCSYFMKVAKISRMPTIECHHLQQCCNVFTYASEPTLNTDSLKHLSGDDKYKIFSDSTIHHCKMLFEICNEKQFNLVVAVNDNERFIHFSVFNNAVYYYAKLGRVAVTADMLNGFLHCNCCSRKRGMQVFFL